MNRIDKRYAKLAAKVKRQREQLADERIKKRALLAGCASDLLKIAEDMERRGRPKELSKMVREYAKRYARKARIDRL